MTSLSALRIIPGLFPPSAVCASSNQVSAGSARGAIVAVLVHRAAIVLDAVRTDPVVGRITFGLAGTGQKEWNKARNTYT